MAFPRPLVVDDVLCRNRRAMLASKRSAFVAAWDGFDQAVRRHPDWPYARLGLALTALEIYVRHYPVPANYDDVASGTHYDGYALQMQRALRAESGFVPAVDWVVASMIASGDYQQPGAIIEALKYIADSTDVIDPRVDLVLARVELQRGNPAQSMRRIGTYLRQGGQARRLSRRGRSPQWVRPIRRRFLPCRSPRTVRRGEGRLPADIDWSPRPTRWHTSRLRRSGRRICHRILGRRDAQEFQRHGSQLQEHLRRWAYVSQHFPAPDPGIAPCSPGVDFAPGGRAPPTTATRAQGAPALPRGCWSTAAVLYTRYGHPAPDGYGRIARRCR